MGIVDMITDKVADKVLDLGTQKLRELLVTMIRELGEYAETTVNPYDNIIVEAIRRELQIKKSEIDGDGK